MCGIPGLISRTREVPPAVAELGDLICHSDQRAAADRDNRIVCNGNHDGLEFDADSPTSFKSYRTRPEEILKASQP